MPLAPLPPSTVKLIGSSQVITSVSSVIKELMENSIDSGAQHIEIKLEKHGLEKIEIKDDGCGIGKIDATVVCLPNYTSKISNFSDLDSLSSYGFRGEALSSLCNVAQVSVTTKTADDDVATCYTYDHSGQITCSTISHLSKGTIITVKDLFKNLPVRKQFVSNSKRAAEELRRVEKVVKSLGMVHPRLRVTLVHNKFLIWQKTSVANLRQSIMQVVSLNIVKQLHHILQSSEQIRVEMFVPKHDSDISSMCFSNFSDAHFLFINNRPVRSKEVEKAVYNKLFEFFGVYVPANKYPVCVTSLTIPADCLDVNLEPNKTRVYFKNHDEVVDFINQCLHIYYGEKEREVENSSVKPSKKRKVEEENPVDAKKVILEPNDNNVVVKTDFHTIEQDLKFLNSIDNIEGSQSNSETVTCSAESIAEEKSSLSISDVDGVFEQFCEEREKELCINSQGESVNQISLDVEPPHIDSENSSGNMYSVFFPHASHKSALGESESRPNISENTNLLSYINRQNSELKISENKNDCSKKLVDCLKKASEISSVASKVPTMDAYLSQNQQSSQDESTIIYLAEPNQSQNDNGGCEAELFEDEDSPIKNEQHLELDLCSPTLSQWSKGAIVNRVGDQVQGPGVLGGRPQPGSPCSSQALSNRSVSSQMGCKEMSAFTKFARKMRKEILKDRPELSFTKVAQMLQNQWRHLDTDEKNKFQETVKITKSPCSKNASKQPPISAFWKNPPSTELDVSVEKIRWMAKEPKYVRRAADSAIHLVGQLEASSLWLYHEHGAGVFALSVGRLREAVLYHQLLADFAVPSKLLTDSLTITPRDMEAAEWELLISLGRSANGVITDERFTKNGLIIEIADEDVEAQLSYVPQHVAYFGVEDVQEILNKLLTHGPNTSLSQCRPLKIISFLRSEVMRECSKTDPPSQPEQVSELLSYWVNCGSPQSQDCIHYHPVSHCLCPT